MMLMAGGCVLLCGTDSSSTDTVPLGEASIKAQTLRSHWDRSLIEQLNNNINDRFNADFFYKPPVNLLSLFFKNSALEQDYRNHYHINSHLFQKDGVVFPLYHSLVEMTLSLFLFALLAIVVFTFFQHHVMFYVTFPICIIFEAFLLVDVITNVKLGRAKKKLCPRFTRYMSSWIVQNTAGVVAAFLPALAIIMSMSCDLAEDANWHDRFYCFCLMVSLLNCCNFTMLISWLKSLAATVVGMALLVLLNVSFCDFNIHYVHDTATCTLMVRMSIINVSPGNVTAATPSTLSLDPLHGLLFSGTNLLRYEMVLDVLLILILIWFINREFEISHRLNFHCKAVSDSDTQQMQENKDQADWLLHNIIPEHVSDVVKRTSKYSKNHNNVAVIFATIVNFNEFYDESFKGGREYIRVLNELVSDYEDLLDRPCFKDVEKIKTICSSFMAASGLNEASRLSNNHPNAHLFALMDFAVELQNVVSNFNDSLFNFDFVLNIGYNFGEVTAGVIGTTKLLYDIWGDTVNIASRMYSTGERGRIQVPESTLDCLGEMFQFDYRGEIFVKGKGNMKTYLYNRKRPGAHWH